MMNWIRVEDRLPEPFLHVLVYDGMSVEESYYGDEEWEGVTHWMPMPKPPLDDDKEG